jgi:aspartyl protease family protein
MIRFVIPLALLAAALVALLWHGEGTIAGLGPDQIARAGALLAVGVFAFGSVLHHFRGRLPAALEAAVFWLAAMVLLVAGYSYRFELGEAANRVVGSVVPGIAVTGRGGEVSVMRHGGDLHFALDARVNGARASFLFDTGASSVVLTPETARAAGLDLARLDFSADVSTANGRAKAAPVRIDRLTVGAIEERDVEALVARPGALSENLLGMSFLRRLGSYEVRGDRLILRGRG